MTSLESRRSRSPGRPREASSRADFCRARSEWTRRRFDVGGGGEHLLSGPRGLAASDCRTSLPRSWRRSPRASVQHMGSSEPNPFDAPFRESRDARRAPSSAERLRESSETGWHRLRASKSRVRAWCEDSTPSFCASSNRGGTYSALATRPSHIERAPPSARLTTNTPCGERSKTTFVRQESRSSFEWTARAHIGRPRCAQCSPPSGCSCCTARHICRDSMASSSDRTANIEPGLPRTARSVSPISRVSVTRCSTPSTSCGVGRRSRGRRHTRCGARAPPSSSTARSYARG